MKKIVLISLMLITSLFSFASKDSIKKFDYCFQQTIVGQYSISNPKEIGRNTFNDSAMRTSLSSTFFFGIKLWKGGVIYINPEIAGGSGLSGTMGIASYPNGEVFRVGNPSPTLFIARAFYRQNISLNDEFEYVSKDQNQLADFVTNKRIVITLGKLSLADVFDNNHYSHDPRTRLLNWSLMNAGAWDFASNTKGYTYAGIVEYISKQISLRLGLGLEPMIANGPLSNHKMLDMEFQLTNGYSFNYEIEIPLKINKEKETKIRFLTFVNDTHAGYYEDVKHTKINDSIIIDNTSLSMYNIRNPNGSIKYGFSMNIEQPIKEHSGMFLRYSYNDGKTESWAFAEIDKSLSFGIVSHGGLWNRFHDRIIIGLAFNGLSDYHKDYLAQGAYGFMIGDGKLNYGYENILEIQYEFSIGLGFIISPDYQLIINPGYNKNNGPVNIFGIRTHIQF